MLSHRTRLLLEKIYLKFFVTTKLCEIAKVQNIFLRKNFWVKILGSLKKFDHFCTDFAAAHHQQNRTNFGRLRENGDRRRQVAGERSQNQGAAAATQPQQQYARTPRQCQRRQSPSAELCLRVRVRLSGVRQSQNVLISEIFFFIF